VPLKLLLKLESRLYKKINEMEKLTKTIYQTWYTKVLPEPIQKSIDNMLNLNPEFD
jgi:mannosyltransferase OCH1-like enzyme